MHHGLINSSVIIIAKYFIVFPVLLALLVLIDIEHRRDQIRFVAFLILSGLLSLIIAKIGAHIIHDPRPFVVGKFTPLISHSADNGFPSDHVLLAALLSWVCLPYEKKLALGSLVIAVLIGLARMKVGVHHLEDIVGSVVITGFATLVVSSAMNYAKRTTHTPQKDLAE